MGKDEPSKLELFSTTADPKATAPPDRASESVVSAVDPHELLNRAPSVNVKQTPAISSGPFEISSLAPPDSEPAPAQAAQTEQIEHAMGRARGIVPLSKIIAIGAGVFLVVVLLIVVVLFR